ncbi:autophagy-related 2 isoform a [Anaeramoeba ignava]|uniref:Autophagy-related protein 2 n=1 Tax=Anaeramoeba ignava TaxID=1746090 RepID=A0A9Q0LNQ1_ANAIG|nr:autophagy-related 2 isoform a [Anaeramoeba ignava]
MQHLKNFVNNKILKSPNRIIAYILSKVLGEYVLSGFNAENCSPSLGTKNISVKLEKLLFSPIKINQHLNDFDLPFKFVSGSIQMLQVSIPYSLSSCLVEINNIVIKCQFIKQFTSSETIPKEEVKKVEIPQEENQGIIKKAIENILNNLEINITNVILILEIPEENNATYKIELDKISFKQSKISSEIFSSLKLKDKKNIDNSNDMKNFIDLNDLNDSNDSNSMSDIDDEDEDDDDEFILVSEFDENNSSQSYENSDLLLIKNSLSKNITINHLKISSEFSNNDNENKKKSILFTNEKEIQIQIIQDQRNPSQIEQMKKQNKETEKLPNHFQIKLGEIELKTDPVQLNCFLKLLNTRQEIAENHKYENNKENHNFNDFDNDFDNDINDNDIDIDDDIDDEMFKSFTESVVLTEKIENKKVAQKINQIIVKDQIKEQKQTIKELSKSFVHFKNTFSDLHQPEMEKKEKLMESIYDLNKKKKIESLFEFSIKKCTLRLFYQDSGKENLFLENNLPENTQSFLQIQMLDFLLTFEKSQESILKFNITNFSLQEFVMDKENQKTNVNTILHFANDPKNFSKDIEIHMDETNKKRKLEFTTKNIITMIDLETLIRFYEFYNTLKIDNIPKSKSKSKIQSEEKNAQITSFNSNIFDISFSFAINSIDMELIINLTKFRIASEDISKNIIIDFKELDTILKSQNDNPNKKDFPEAFFQILNSLENSNPFLEMKLDRSTNFEFNEANFVQIENNNYIGKYPFLPFNNINQISNFHEKLSELPKQKLSVNIEKINFNLTHELINNLFLFSLEITKKIQKMEETKNLIEQNQKEKIITLQETPFEMEINITKILISIEQYENEQIPNVLIPANHSFKFSIDKINFIFIPNIYNENCMYIYLKCDDFSLIDVYNDCWNPEKMITSKILSKRISHSNSKKPILSFLFIQNESLNLLTNTNIISETIIELKMQNIKYSHVVSTDIITRLSYMIPSFTQQSISEKKESKIEMKTTNQKIMHLNIFQKNFVVEYFPITLPAALVISVREISLIQQKTSSSLNSLMNLKVSNLSVKLTDYQNHWSEKTKGIKPYFVEIIHGKHLFSQIEIKSQNSNENQNQNQNSNQNQNQNQIIISINNNDLHAKFRCDSFFAFLDIINHINYLLDIPEKYRKEIPEFHEQIISIPNFVKNSNQNENPKSSQKGNLFPNISSFYEMDNSRNLINDSIKLIKSAEIKTQKNEKFSVKWENSLSRKEITIQDSEYLNHPQNWMNEKKKKMIEENEKRRISQNKRDHQEYLQLKFLVLKANIVIRFEKLSANLKIFDGLDFPLEKIIKIEKENLEEIETQIELEKNYISDLNQSQKNIEMNNLEANENIFKVETKREEKVMNENIKIEENQEKTNREDYIEIMIENTTINLLLFQKKPLRKVILDAVIGKVLIQDHVSSSVYLNILSYMSKHKKPKDVLKPMAHIFFEIIDPLFDTEKLIKGTDELLLDAVISPLRINLDIRTLYFLSRFFSYFPPFYKRTLETVKIPPPFFQKILIGFLEFEISITYPLPKSLHAKIDRIHLQMPKLKMIGKNGFDQVMETFQNYYLKAIMTKKQILSIAGSLPGLNSFKNIGKGMKELITKPIDSYNSGGSVLSGVWDGINSLTKVILIEGLRSGKAIINTSETTIDMISGDSISENQQQDHEMDGIIQEIDEGFQIVRNDPKNSSQSKNHKNYFLKKIGNFSKQGLKKIHEKINDTIDYLDPKRKEERKDKYKKKEK